MAGTFFYDGECGLCSGAVDFLKRRDHQQCLKFSPLQSPEAAAQLPTELTSDLKTAVFLSNEDSEKLHLRSDAVLSALNEIGGIWSFLARVAKLIPLSLRNRCYERIAANRNRCGWQNKHLDKP